MSQPAAPRDQLFKALVENSYDGVALTSVDGARFYLSPAFFRLLGYTPEEYAEIKPFEVVHEEDRESMQGAFRAAAERSGSMKVAEIRVVRKDGEIRHTEATITNRLDDHEIQALVINWRDVTERKKAEDALRASIEALRKIDDERRALLSRLVESQEEERRRIASEVHDDSIQVMTAVNLQLQMIRRALGDNEQSAKLASIEETVSKATARLRHLIFELNPPALTRHGLATALDEYLEQLREDSEIDFRLEAELQIEPPVELRIVAYRIVQEALTNVRKHANAKMVGVSIATKDDGLFVRITDDGVGFDPAAASYPAPGHLGLLNMKQRAELAGGWCTIDSSPGSGTVVEAWIPIQSAR